MSDPSSRMPYAHDHQEHHHKESDSVLASGGVMFAGVLMMLDGMFSAIAGISAIAEDDVYTRVGDYVFELNLTAWGWIHLAVGVIVVAAGAGVMRGAGWARGIGVTLAALIVLLQFLWLPYQPVWSLVSIAIAVFVIWALCTETGRAPARPTD
ncbi:DUF7144 family membrane protein [Streptomyces cavernicola]|uniref:DUF7144 domain-containing protein n=1 Tax=Streptomyces cavernicola TaxID=3043613 RepID=A0ABT6SCV8_9ACTN|nr:hypothetical protein [Streptomyces sp. B-S-A6]MDI3406023.1 hypothetical protein [Streptomyces sp. B-S-A6]